MSLSNLTTAGWILFAWTVLTSLAFAARLVSRDFRGIALHIAVVAICGVWLHWLVTP